MTRSPRSITVSRRSDRSDSDDGQPQDRADVARLEEAEHTEGLTDK